MNWKAVESRRDRRLQANGSLIVTRYWRGRAKELRHIRGWLPAITGAWDEPIRYLDGRTQRIHKGGKP